MSEQNSVVAVYASHVEAEEAIKQLEREGIDMRTLSIVGKGTHSDEHVVGYYNNGDRMMYWGKTGAYWGGFWGLLFGSAFFAVPGIGPVLAAGPVVAWIVGGLESAAFLGGMSAIGAGLFGIGIPKDSVIQYETAVKTDKFLLMVSGSYVEMERARLIVEKTSHLAMNVHDAGLASAAAGSS